MFKVKKIDMDLCTNKLLLIVIFIGVLHVCLNASAEENVYRIALQVEDKSYWEGITNGLQNLGLDLSEEVHYIECFLLAFASFSPALNMVNNILYR